MVVARCLRGLLLLHYDMFCVEVKFSAIRMARARKRSTVALVACLGNDCPERECCLPLIPLQVLSQAGSIYGEFRTFCHFRGMQKVICHPSNSLVSRCSVRRCQSASLLQYSVLLPNARFPGFWFNTTREISRSSSFSHTRSCWFYKNLSVDGMLWSRVGLLFSDVFFLLVTTLFS